MSSNPLQPLEIDRTPRTCLVHGVRIAYFVDESDLHSVSGRNVLWLNGLKSDMCGEKASTVAQWCRSHGHRLVRMDYSGHGLSDGEFSEGTLSKWLDEVEAVIVAADGTSSHPATEGTAGESPFVSRPWVLVGSSMGGWLAMILADRWMKGAMAAPSDAPPVSYATEPRSVGGVVLIAPALRMTTELLMKDLTPALHKELDDTGYCTIPSDYGDGFRLSRAFFEDGAAHDQRFGNTSWTCPVRVLHGLEDASVPYTAALDVMKYIKAPSVTATLVQGGDHRLSSPDDLARLIATLEEVAGWEPK